MKNIIYSFLVYAISLTACTKKTDNIFSESADVRLAKTLTDYQTALTSAPGWKLFVYPKGLESQDIKVGGLTYYVKFTNNNRVTMVSDFDTAIAATPKESGYRLKAVQRPSLIFDTYTYMHIPADPDPEVSLSPTGSGGYGYGTDYNFSFKELTPKDTIQLEGNFNKSVAILVKATQTEMDAAFNNKRLRSIIDVTRAYQAANPFLYIEASPTVRVGIGFDFSHFLLSVSSVESGQLINKTVAFSYTTYGLHLGSPVTIGNNTFTDVYWDDVKKLYYITSGTTRIEFLTSPTPVISLSLQNSLGTQYSTISVPPNTVLPNMSPLFITRYNAAKSGMLAGPFGLSMYDMDFVFNGPLKVMSVNVYVYQGTVGPFLCQYIYSYTVDASGVFKFTKVSQNGNAALVVANMNNILSYIENDQFNIVGYSTSSSFLGQLTSRQTPAFYFTGYLF